MEKVIFRLPVAEDDLWQQVVVRLLAQRDVDEAQAGNHLRLLEELAFHFRFCGKPLTRPFAEDTATWLAKEREFGSPRDTAQGWLATVERWDLLVRQGNGQKATYEFAIPGLDEYFAARHLAARWAEGDAQYRAWLPCAAGWWERGATMRCPNPCCCALLPPFRAVLCQAEYEAPLLLMVSLVREAERELLFLNGIRGYYDFTRQAYRKMAIRSRLNLELKTLSRCRNVHPDLARDIAQHIFDLLPPENVLTDLSDGLAAMGRARVRENLAPILDYCARKLARRELESTRATAALALGGIGHAWAVEPLVRALGEANDITELAVYWAADKALRKLGEAAAEGLRSALWNQSWRVLRVVAPTLGRLGDAQAVDQLIAALEDEAWQARENAAFALGCMGATHAIPALHRLVHDPIKWVRQAAEGALEEIERANWHGEREQS